MIDDRLGGRIRRLEILDADKMTRESVCSRLWKHYGLFAPVLFTIALLVVFLLTG